MTVRVAYLPLSLARRDLRAAEKPGVDVLRPAAGRPAWRTIARLWWANRSGGAP